MAPVSKILNGSYTCPPEAQLQRKLKKKKICLLSRGPFRQVAPISESARKGSLSLLSRGFDESAEISLFPL